MINEGYNFIKILFIYFQQYLSTSWWKFLWKYYNNILKHKYMWNIILSMSKIFTKQFSTNRKVAKWGVRGKLKVLNVCFHIFLQLFFSSISPMHVCVEKCRLYRVKTDSVYMQICSPSVVWKMYVECWCTLNICIH